MSIYKLEFEVRDSELDMQSIVNNANYFIYFAHTRHKYLKDVLGISFAEMSAAEQYLLLISTTMEFKKPLRAEDRFYVTCQIVPEGKVRIGFQQEIRKCDEAETLMVKAYNVGACMDGKRNRPYIPEIIKQHFPTQELSNACG